MIKRKLTNILIMFDTDGTPIITATATVTDSDEGTESGASKVFKQQALVTVATQLRDGIMTLAENAGKPLTVGDDV